MKHWFFVVYIFIIAAAGRHVFAQETWLKASPATTTLKSIETTPYGILAGENDSRLWLAPFNGIYISKDLGQTWSKLTIRDRGITDIAYADGSIYAATYYNYQNLNGLFVSKDGGLSWMHLGGNFSAAAVAVNAGTIYLGGYSHGLWVSKDDGATWTQKVGSGYFGPKINVIKSTNDVTIAASANTTYISVNGGESFEEISALNGRTFDFAAIYKNIILLGGRNVLNLFRSQDYGKTWQIVENWGNYPAGAVTYIYSRFYAGKKCDTSPNYCVYESTNGGVTWQNIGLDAPGAKDNVSDFAVVSSQPDKLFALLPGIGIYRYEIPPNIKVFPFLNIPWDAVTDYELVDRITSYFDHEYPLLGYIYYSEPPQTKQSTLNYLGIKEKEPAMYYSSHDGFDYALKYGTPLKAAAAGYASYYYCKDCGHTIKIDHQNGYQSIYMHLQQNGLVTRSAKVWVEAGDVIGLVGLSGRTTGPHLHLAIQKGNEYPGGKVDPYGWQAKNLADPWEQFAWTDGLGAHTGTQSAYLWNNQTASEPKAIYITPAQETIIQKDNKKVEVKQGSLTVSATMILQHYIAPKIPLAQKFLTYVEGTSMLLNAYDNNGNAVSAFLNPLTIQIDFSGADLLNIKPDSLKIYFWDEELEVWRPLQTVVDLAAKIIKADTSHLSQFAVLGAKIDTEAPQSNINIIGEITGDWYVEYPGVEITSTDGEGAGIDHIFYTLDDGVNWNTYLQPFTAEKEGIYPVKFRAADKAGNWEEEHSVLIRVDTQNKRKNSVKITGGTFMTR